MRGLETGLSLLFYTDEKQTLATMANLISMYPFVFKADTFSGFRCFRYF